jgi:hypothetical protein
VLAAKGLIPAYAPWCLPNGRMGRRHTDGRRPKNCFGRLCNWTLPSDVANVARCDTILNSVATEKGPSLFVGAHRRPWETGAIASL